MAGNIFINNDPLLGGRDFTSNIEMMERELAAKQAQLAQYKQQMVQQPQQSQTPVWDEIDSIIQSMTEKEYQIVSTNDEWIDSNNRILALIQSAQLQMLRPIIEQSKEGKDALDNHLTITKRVKKSASMEVDSELNDFQEYKSKYSHMSYDEYQKMKRESKKIKK
jgi:2-succinyl-5-enolpyruvyl-6-hydroxy-3-cyclohexene-1-carboxylate synthase